MYLFKPLDAIQSCEFIQAVRSLQAATPARRQTPLVDAQHRRRVLMASATGKSASGSFPLPRRCR